MGNNILTYDELQHLSEASNAAYESSQSKLVAAQIALRHIEDRLDRAGVEQADSVLERVEALIDALDN